MGDREGGREGGMMSSEGLHVNGFIKTVRNNRIIAGSPKSSLLADQSTKGSKQNEQVRQLTVPQEVGIVYVNSVCE